jgi:uncharacterized phage protein (TIGR02220 family)
MPFVKLDCSIVYSSIWSESADTCKVWITMLAMADQTGLVPATAPGISTASFIPIETTRKSIAVLETPDPDSKSMEHEGRRIKRVEGGYLILNYDKYRSFNYSMRKDAIRKREYRTKEKEAVRDIKRDIVPKCPGHSASVSASEVLSYLNSKTGRKYKNFKNILPRLQEGHSVDELKAIIDTKAQDPYFIENPHYMNPETLFRPSNFDRYLNQTPQDFHGKTKARPATLIRPPEPASEPTLEEKIQRAKDMRDRYANHPEKRFRDMVPAIDQELAELQEEK